MEDYQAKFLSKNKPYLSLIPPFEYDPKYCNKTAYQMIKERAKNYHNVLAMNFYGRKINTGLFFDELDIVSKCYTNIGLKKDENISFFGLNTPELVESLYAVNRLGAISEWFNPNAITPQLLKNHIIKNNVSAIFTIDLMYDIVKEAIVGTPVKFVIVNSMMDSLPKSKNILYYLKTFGLDSFTNLDALKKYREEIYMKLEQAHTHQEKDQIINNFSFLENLLYNIYEYCYKDKIFAKASFWVDQEKDSRFISWSDFIDKYYYVNTQVNENDDFEKMSMVIHTGGTTGPIKRIAMNDYAINSAPYQYTLMPNSFKVGDSVLQLVPPMVAWSLECLHAARFFNMTLNMIATYDRNEFAKIILKTKSNHYFTVPSFVKRIKEDPLLANKDLSFIKTIFYGGEAIDTEDEKTIDDILKRNGSQTKGALGFGQNEEFAAFFVNLTLPGKEKVYGTCGIPLAGNDYIIYDIESQKELPYGINKDGKYNIGNLLVSGPSTMMGYIGDDEYLNEKAIIYIDGKKYIDTGDLAYADENGRLYFYTREKRMIRTGQGKIFANVIEHLLKQLDAVEDCCVVKMPDEDNVAKASCHIILKEKYRRMPLEMQKKVMDTIIASIEEQTQAMYTYYVPGYYEFRNYPFPKTSFGKCAYRQLEDEDLNDYNNSHHQHKQLEKVRINYQK